MKLISLFALTLMSTPIFAQTDSPSDNAAITKTALDYIEGWYTGDAVRMERALHPELAKRMISTDLKTGRSQFLGGDFRRPENWMVLGRTAHM